MTSSIRCPVCDLDFQPAPSAPDSHSCECPYCRHTWGSAEAAAARTAAAIELPIRKPKAVQPRSTAATPLPPTAPLPADPSPVAEWRVEATSQRRDSHPQLTTGRSSRGRHVLWALSVFSVAALVTCGYVLYAQFGARRDASASASTLSDSAASDSSSAGQARGLATNPTAAEPTIATNAESEPAPTPTVNELDRLRFLANDQYLSLWSKLYPYLVELRVHRGNETRQVAGVIVDSRGWVATSWTAIRDAEWIEVRPAAKAFNSAQVTGELVDECRGLLAHNPGHDLALVAINRRLVGGFSALPIDRGELIVGGDTLIGAAPPPEKERIWLFDAPIQQSATRDRLPAPIQGRIPSPADPIESSAVWLICGGPADRLRLGVPLFTPQAQLAGMLVAGSQSTEGVAITAAAIDQLCQQAGETVRAFPLPGNGGGAETDTMPLHAGDPSAQDPRLTELEASATAVLQGGAFSDQPEQYESFRAFAENLLRVDRELGEADDSAEARRELDRVLDRFQIQLADQWTLGQFKVAGFNALAWDATTLDGAAFAAVGTVDQAGITAPKINGRETIVFRLEPTDQRLITTLTHHPEIFLPGSRWLIVGASQSAAPEFHGSIPMPYTARRCLITRVFSVESGE